MKDILNEQLIQITKQSSDLATMINKMQNKITDLQNNNVLLKKENEYLKRKLFDTKSEKSLYPLILTSFLFLTKQNRFVMKSC